MGSLWTVQLRGQVQWNDVYALPVESHLGTNFKRENLKIFLAESGSSNLQVTSPGHVKNQGLGEMLAA